MFGMARSHNIIAHVIVVRRCLVTAYDEIRHPSAAQKSTIINLSTRLKQKFGQIEPPLLEYPFL